MRESPQTRHRSPSPLARPPIGVNRPLGPTERQRIHNYALNSGRGHERQKLRQSYVMHVDSHINSPQHGAQEVRDTEKELRTQKKEPFSRTSGGFKAMRPSYKEKKNKDDVIWDESSRSLNRRIYGSSDDDEVEGNRSDSDNSSWRARKPSRDHDLDNVEWTPRALAHEPARRKDDGSWERGGNRNRHDSIETPAVSLGLEDAYREIESRGREREKRRVFKKGKNRMTVSPLSEHTRLERENRIRDRDYERLRLRNLYGY